MMIVLFLFCGFIQVLDVTLLKTLRDFHSKTVANW